MLVQINSQVQKTKLVDPRTETSPRGRRSACTTNNPQRSMWPCAPRTWTRPRGLLQTVLVIPTRLRLASQPSHSGDPATRNRELFPRHDGLRQGWPEPYWPSLRTASGCGACSPLASNRLPPTACLQPLASNRLFSTTCPLSRWRLDQRQPYSGGRFAGGILWRGYAGTLRTVWKCGGRSYVRPQPREASPCHVWRRTSS